MLRLMDQWLYIAKVERRGGGEGGEFLGILWFSMGTERESAVANRVWKGTIENWQPLKCQ